jgi:hypothetical protein
MAAKMGTARILGVGRSDQASYLAFGDDSQFGDTLAYAFAIVHCARAEMVEARLLALKEQFNIPQGTPLHCRVLFSGQQREQARLGHLTPQDAQLIVKRAVTIMNRGPVLVRYAVGSLAEWRLAIGDELEMHHETDDTTTKEPVKNDPKGLLSMLMQACFYVPPNGSEGPIASECKIFVSEDSTMIKFIGNRRRRADRMYSGFLDIGAPPGHVFQLEPIATDAGSQPLLQLADIAAYICSHNFSQTSGNTFFQEQHNRMRHWLRKIFVVDAPGGDRSEMPR